LASMTLASLGLRPPAISCFSASISAKLLKDKSVYQRHISTSEIAAHLAQGLNLVEAVEAAHIWVRNAMLHGLDLRLGAGHGPLNHFHHPLALMPLETSHA